MKKLELLAPVGDWERLENAVYFGADAVYFAGKRFGLRAFGVNFDLDEIKKAVEFCHSHNVKVYITINILAHNQDFIGLVDYLKYLDKVGVDGVIVSDLGIANLVLENTKLDLHVSTQANITNVESAKMWVKLGAKRLVLARELTIEEVKQIKDAIGDEIEIECFCHGAMCISYSGRCLLSNYLTRRDSNKGECAQPCRWNYTIKNHNPESSNEDEFPIEEDQRGTYILNSKDMCLIEHIEELANAGITSLKIEGRMKAAYYVATVVNAYRRAIDDFEGKKLHSFQYIEELEKTSHRMFTTGFYFKSDEKTNCSSSLYEQSHEFIARVVEDQKDGFVLVERRNKFSKGDELEVLSPTDNFNKKIVVDIIKDDAGNELEVVNKVMQKVYIKTDLPLKKNDILRRKIGE